MPQNSSIQTMGQDPKKVYAAPLLRNLGNVASLTLSGSGSRVESVQPSSCSQDTGRRSCTAG